MIQGKQSMLINVGDLFRHYRVIESVGEGGMGVVYRARDTKLDRDVALKFMVHATRVNSDHADRLRREARALAALNHPNILTIHDIGETDGLPFLVLEWVGGGALSGASLQWPLSTREFLRIVLEQRGRTIDPTCSGARAERGIGAPASDCARRGAGVPADKEKMGRLIPADEPPPTRTERSGAVGPRERSALVGVQGTPTN